MAKPDLNQLDNIGKDINGETGHKPKDKGGRPRGELSGDKAFTVRMSENLHKRLKLAAMAEDKPMNELAIEILQEHLDRYELKKV